MTYNMKVANIQQNIVQQVLVADSVEWCVINLGGQWVHTYDNTAGYNFAGVGFTYHPDKDNFSSPQPYESWTLDDYCIWQPPVPYPSNEGLYTWDEQLKQWIKYETN